MPGKADPERGVVLNDWQETFGSPPPPYLSVAFMRRALAHEDQCKRHGRLPSSTQTALRKIAAGKPASDCIPQVASAGSHLVREWNGRTYQVEVLAKGYRMDGKEWSSLSAISRHITGTNWSGPRFFGLTRRSGVSQ